MSINQANTPDGRGVLIFNGETILVYCPSCQMTFDKTGNNPQLHGKKRGAVYLTSHRIIFMPDDKKDEIRSFDMPFAAMEGVKLEQPIFGANYLTGMAASQPGGGLAGETRWRLTFDKGGCIDFGMALLKAVELAERSRPANAPPPYAPTPANYYAAPPAYFEPTNIGFQAPTQQFPERPDNVFMQEAPPPYPGMGSEQAPRATEELVPAGQTLPPSYSSIDSTGLRRRGN